MRARSRGDCVPALAAAAPAASRWAGVELRPMQAGVGGVLRVRGGDAAEHSRPAAASRTGRADFMVITPWRCRWHRGEPARGRSRGSRRAVGVGLVGVRRRSLSQPAPALRHCKPTAVPVLRASSRGRSASAAGDRGEAPRGDQPACGARAWCSCAACAPARCWRADARAVAGRCAGGIVQSSRGDRRFEIDCRRGSSPVLQLLAQAPRARATGASSPSLRCSPWRARCRRRRVPPARAA